MEAAVTKKTKQSDTAFNAIIDTVNNSNAVPTSLDILNKEHQFQKTQYKNSQKRNS
jgi:hypothetical protein